MRDNGLKQNGSFRSRVTLTVGHVATAPGVVGVEAQPLDIRCAHLCRAGRPVKVFLEIFSPVRIGRVTFTFPAIKPCSLFTVTAGS